MNNIKIKIKGAYGATNFGDDLLMCLFEKYFLNNFKNIDLNFEGIDMKYPDKLLVKAKYNSKSFNEDWFIYGGGTQFFSFQQTHSKTFFGLIKKAITSPNKAMKKLLSMLEPKKTVNKHVAFLGFGLGPFYDNNEKIEQVKKTLSSAHFIGLRDEVSINYCKEWGINAFFGADMAYSSYFDYQVSSDKKQNVKKKIGIVVRDWVWEESGRGYFEPILDLYKNRNEDYDFQFIIYAPDKDPEWMKRLKDEDTLIWDPNKYSIQEFLDTLNKFDGFISARFHGAIVGALLGKPVISIEIEPKLRILTEDIKELFLWEKPFNLDDLNKLLDKMDYNVDYATSLDILRTRADFALEKFRGVFNKDQ